ncbi:uncharacterized protein LOC135212533 [Macrobrachium nipponense]|uniref:uncharacterized protein LOC135212533 n=1 Tax=Macrobrachium nipponense TaxID=159736 RepID=UPI0030C7F62C
MEFKVVIILTALAALTSAHPGTVLDIAEEDHAHKQEGETGHKVEGSYSWTSPEGTEFYVKYIADELGYRIVESNAVPISSGGVAADGNQGSFSGEEGEEKEVSFGGQGGGEGEGKEA